MTKFLSVVHNLVVRQLVSSTLPMKVSPNRLWQLTKWPTLKGRSIWIANPEKRSNISPWTAKPKTKPNPPAAAIIVVSGSSKTKCATKDRVRIKTKMPESWTSIRGGGLCETFFINVFQKNRSSSRLKSHPAENQINNSRKTSTPRWNHPGKGRSFSNAMRKTVITIKKIVKRVGIKAAWNIFFSITN